MNHIMNHLRGKTKYELPLNPTADEIKHWNLLYVKKQWRDRNKDKIALCNKSEGSRLSKKKYLETHRDKYLESMRNYYEENKEKFKRKVECDVCGKEYLYTSSTSHKKTKFHQKALLLNELKVKAPIVD